MWYSMYAFITYTPYCYPCILSGGPDHMIVGFTATYAIRISEEKNKLKVNEKDKTSCL
jgi:hypothetical protein